jgi:hypothetical protein
LNKVFHHLLITCCLLAFALSAFAQADSNAVKPLLTKKGKLSTKNDTWFHWWEPETHFVIDSDIYNIEEYNHVQRDGIEHLNLGNTGSPTFPLVFSSPNVLGFDAGINQFDLYRFKRDSAKYYQVVRPYTELSYTLGLKNEQRFNGKFANRHKNILYYGVEFNRLFSKGIYTNQRTNDNGFNLYGIYNSKNGYWNVQADVVFNNAKVQENGGVTVDVTNKDSTSLSKLLVPVGLEVAENKYTEVDFYLKTFYNIGKKVTVMKDTTATKVLLPMFRVSHQFNIGSNKYNYRDVSPDSSFYGSFYGTDDSAYNYFKYVKVSNQLSFDYTGKKEITDSSSTDRNIAATATVGIDYFATNQNNLKDKFTNLYVMAVLRNNSNSGSRLVYKGVASYYFYGYNQNDLLLDAHLGYDFGKFGLLTANSSYELKEQDWIVQNFKSHSANWSNSFPKSNTLSIGGRYQLQKYGVSLMGNYYFLKNFAYFSAPDKPQIETKNTNVLVLWLAHRFAIKGFHLDNDVWFQKVVNSSNLRFPMFVTKHSVYYEHRVFKKVLWFSTGFDLRYNTPFYANAYFPLTGQYYLQNVRQNKFYPVLDFFLNVKIKTVRVALKVDNISSYFGKQRGYYTAYGYPASDLSFRVTVMWRFFE